MTVPAAAAMHLQNEKWEQSKFKVLSYLFDHSPSLLIDATAAQINGAIQINSAQSTNSAGLLGTTGGGPNSHRGEGKSPTLCYMRAA